MTLYNGNYHKSLPYLVILLVFAAQAASAQPGSAILTVPKTTDFTVTGDGSNANWAKAAWTNLTQRDKGTLATQQWDVSALPGNDIQYATAVKILYSDNGVYCLFRCEDSLITATHKSDNAELYNEDVVEVFLKPDADAPVYFEYELSPLNFELPLLIQNNEGKFAGWLPYMYKGGNRVQHAVAMGAKNNVNRFTWTAEMFIPYVLIAPIKNVPPQKGTQWRANFYRIDYDRNPVYTSWQLTRRSYHDPEKFGILQFD